MNYNNYLLSLANKMNDSTEGTDAINIGIRSLEILRELLANEHARVFQDVLDQHNAVWYCFDITLNKTLRYRQAKEQSRAQSYVLRIEEELRIYKECMGEWSFEN
jgi:hypothetical protein